MTIKEAIARDLIFIVLILAFLLSSIAGSLAVAFQEPECPKCPECPVVEKPGPEKV